MCVNIFELTLSPEAAESEAQRVRGEFDHIKGNRSAEK